MVPRGPASSGPGSDADRVCVLSLGSSVQNSERGKKIGNAVMTTSRSVVQTGKVVGEHVSPQLLSRTGSSNSPGTFTVPLSNISN